MEEKTTQKSDNELKIITNTGVPGLYLIENFLSEEEERTLCQEIEKGTWKNNRSGERRVQMFGPWHNEKYQVKRGNQITPLPKYCVDLAGKIKTIVNTFLKTQVVISPKLGEENTEIFINEYLPKDDLQFHSDHRTTYEETISGISLLSGSILFFQKGSKEVGVKLPARSIYFMTGDSRYKWKHGMKPCTLDGERRVSITYRVVIYCD